jgi:mannitol 2-dehydrogenase
MQASSASPAKASPKEDQALPLSLAVLDRLPANIARPAYSRAALSPGIVHIGVGNFHRAHMASYLDELFTMGLAHEWAIIGAGVTSHDAAMRERLLPQDWLATLVERDAHGAKARVIGTMVDFIAPSDRKALIARMASPEIRIVSLTITEGGYFLDSSGHFDASHPLIKADAAAPDDPRTAFGLIIAALARRRRAKIAPFTVMSCDNVPHNGDVARGVVTGLAALIDPDLAAWIGGHVAFPNAMVDRIAPAVGDRERQFVAETFGLADAAPVPCEPFRQWVIEDDFCNGRPPLEKVGAIFVTDVTPYERMKIRMLNGGHAAIAYPAGLLDIAFVHEAMDHKLVGPFLAALERREIAPHVPAVPGMTPEHYLTLITERFANPTIGDTIRRLAFDGSNRQPKFIIASIADGLSAGKPVAGLALVSALWRHYCTGKTASGASIEPNDPDWARLNLIARKAEPMAWLDMADIYGETGRDARFRQAFADACKHIEQSGVEAALAAYIAA